MPFTISFPPRSSLHHQHLNFSSSSSLHPPPIDHANHPPKCKPSRKRRSSSTLTLSSPLLSCIEETPEDEYDIGQLNLGAESPALALEESANADGASGVEASGVAGPFMGDVETNSRLFLGPTRARSSLADARANLAARPTSLAGRRSIVPRRRSWRSTGSALARESNNSASSSTTLPKKSRQSAADRDCGICFEYAVSPCRTLCCGKMFCKEHIVDWLHGPSSDGRCPACEKPCSVDKGVLSLASPALLPTTSVNGSTSTTTSTRQIERNGIIASTPSTPSPATTASPTTERTRTHSRSLATRRMSATSTGSSSSGSSSNLSNLATAPSDAGSPITSDDDEPPRYSKHPPPMYSTVNVSSESGTPIPIPSSGGAPVLSSYSAPTAPSERSTAASSAPSSSYQPNQANEVQITSSWKAELAPELTQVSSEENTLERLGRVTSVVGLTLILYTLSSRQLGW